jgi:hypothetical protein
MCERFKKLDVFFHQDIKLTYDKSVTFKSITGAISSIIIVAGIGAYIANGLFYVWGESI